MQRNITKILLRNSFWLAILCHLLLFLSFSLILTSQIKSEEKPDLYIPSYVYHETAASTSAPESKEKNATDKNALEKPAPSRTTPTQPDESHPTQNTTAAIAKNKEDPVHLIGDKKMDKPLLTLLGKAISAHLVYPKTAVDFNIRGVASVGFLLFPDGHITSIQLINSSHAGVLDAAAISAVNAMSPVKNVNLYLHEPKFMVVGIIFG